MALFKCKMCGGDLEVAPGASVAECEYCGTQQTLPKVNDEVIQNLFNRANNLRIKCEFDKAEQIYEKILQENDAQSEAHWGIVLCKYGIEYVEDPKTFKRIPTCHRTSYDAVTADADYLAAIEHADTAQRGIYEAEAKAIDAIQKDILRIVKNEKPFDVFICYKETDENGKRTVDSAIANEIYYQLMQEGLKVFYAAITLEDKLGREYEPYIFAALNSAKVMLVIGTKPQYFSAVWVKNEWSRFLKLMKTDRNKLLIPCYKDMDAYDLPEEFAHLQAQDMGKIGFINDVVRGIKKVTTVEVPKTTVVKETIVSSNTNATPLLKRVFIFLEDGEWDRADDFCEQVLNIDPECAEAYLGKLMAELRVYTREDLKNQKEPFDGYGNYKKAVRYADDKLKTVLTGYIDHINTRNENARLEGIYSKAQSNMRRATTERTFMEAAQLFATISDFKDAAELAEQCREKAIICHNDSIYSKACASMTKKAVNIQEYHSAIAEFQKIPGWKDADEQIELCWKKIKEINEREEAARLEQERKAEIARKAAADRAKRRKNITIVATAIVIALTTFILVFTALREATANKNKYNDALALMEAGNLDKAYSIFTELGNYKDAADKAGDIRLTKTKAQLKGIKAGSYIKFGAYEQDDNTSNGKEDIEWLILEVEDAKALVISKYALDCKPYNTSDTDVTWEICTLRAWLNNDFIDSAFSANEKAMIPTVTISADKNPEYGTDSGNATQDQIFLLSITEATKYFNADSARQCEPTNYAVANGAWKTDSGICTWWLRSPGFRHYCAAYVYHGNDFQHGGTVGTSGCFVNRSDAAIRPAMWIDLSKI